jgi:PAS domain-containing protein
MGTRLQSVFRTRSREPWSHFVARYAGAISITAIAVLVRLLFDPFLERSGFAITLVGMLMAAWIGGVGPGLLSQTLLLVAQGLLFSVPEDSKPPWTLEGIVSLVAFYSVGGIVGSLSEAWQAARTRAKSQTNDAISQREQLQATIGCVADGVLVTDSEGRVTLMNPVAEAMTGWSLEESQGKPVRDVFAILDQQSQEIVENPVPRVLREEMRYRKLCGCLSRRAPIGVSRSHLARRRSATAAGRRLASCSSCATKLNAIAPKTRCARPIAARMSFSPHWLTSSATRSRRSAWGWS